MWGDWRIRVVAVLLGVQILLIPAYRSTDFEVHRNWLAITYSLPVRKWYLDATSEWTLDYPPLFAWFEWALAQVAALVDPKMLSVSNLGYDSPATVLFQRLSVSVTGLVLAAAMLYATRADSSSSSSGGGDGRNAHRNGDAIPTPAQASKQQQRQPPSAAAQVQNLQSQQQGHGQGQEGLLLFFLVVANAGLLMVDNIHFQYNGVLLGLLLWSVLMVEETKPVLGGALFAVLLNMKHLFAYAAPVYFVHLLRHYCMAHWVNTDRIYPRHNSTSSTSSKEARAPASRLLRTGFWDFNLADFSRRLLKLGIVVLTIFALSLGPFVALGQLPQLAARLFPFGRGLCHAYWAPNAWALYSLADKALAAGLARAGLVQAPAANMAGGIVGVSRFAVLPQVGPAATSMAVLVALAPCLACLWRRPSARRFAAAVVYANMCGFMLGYHVHEKAALTFVVPMALLAVPMRQRDSGPSAAAGAVGGRGRSSGTLNAADAAGGAAAAAAAAADFLVASTAAHVGIFPLLFKPQEVQLRWVIALLYFVVAVQGLGRLYGPARLRATQKQWVAGEAGSTRSAATAHAAAAEGGTPGVLTRAQARRLSMAGGADGEAAANGAPAHAKMQSPAAVASSAAARAWLPLSYKLYLAGIVPLELYCSIGHGLLLRQRLPFLPLLLTSVYCALGICWVWGRMCLGYVRELCTNAPSTPMFG